MSLQVWLPLNGDLHNQGLDPAIFSKTTENVWGSGKIGEKALLTSTGTNKIMVNGLKNKQKFSIAFWVKVDTTLNFTNNQNIWALEYTNSTGTGPIRFEHASTAGNCKLIVYKETNVGKNTNTYYGVRGAQNYSDNWYHITLTKNQDNTKCYINGNLTNTSSNNQYEASLGKLTGNVTIGASTCAAYLNDVRIYDHCLSSKEVEEISKGLILHYPLNQLYDNNIIYDTSGYCNNGTIVGDITTITPSPRYNCATNFINNISGIKINNNSFSSILNLDFTFSFWIKSNDQGRSIYFGNYSKNPAFNIEKKDNNSLRLYWNGSPDIEFSNTTITNNEWVFITIVKFSTGTIKAYLNGVEKAATGYGFTSQSFSSPWYIGRDSRGDNTAYLGNMSDFRIYCTALSANQIKELYNTSMQIDSSGNVFARELVEL